MTPDNEDRAKLGARISPDVLCRELVGESVLLDLKSQRYFGLDEVGTRIWQLMNDLGQVDKVVDAMLEEFEVDEARLRRELGELLGELAEADLIELGPVDSAAS